MTNEKTLPETTFSVGHPQNTDKVLLELQNSLTSLVGQHFFDAAVTRLNKLVRADFTLIGTLNREGTEVKTISVCSPEALLENIRYSLAGTPCEDVSRGGACIFQSDIASLYPDDTLLREMEVEGYVGVAIMDSLQRPLGIVVSLFKRKVENPDFVRFAFEFLSSRIQAEMERLRMEQAIRDHHERHEFALKAGNLGVYDWNIYADELVFNDRLYEIIEYTPEEFHPTYSKWLSLVHPEDYDQLAVKLQRKIVYNKEYHSPVRYRVRTKSGKYKWIETESYSFIFDEEKKAKRNIGIVKEIDKQVQTEIELSELNKQIRQREEWYAFALKVGNLGVYDWYIKEDRATVSPRLYEMLGYEPGELKLSFYTWLSIVHPDDHWQFNWRSYQLQVTKRQNTLHVYRLRHKSGEYRWIEAQNMAIENDEHGHVVRMIGIIKDIDTEKKSADLLHEAFEKQKELNDALRKREEELTESQSKLIAHMSLLQKLNKDIKESENRWAYALEGNGDGVFDWNLQADDIYLSEKARDIIGLALDDKRNYPEFMNRIHPNFAGEFKTQVDICRKPPYDPLLVETQMRDASGNYRWLMFRGKVVEFDESKPVRMVGTVTDLSAHKVIQKELTVYEEMIKQNQSAILFTSMDGTIEFVNATAADLLEYRQHEIMEKNIAHLLPEKWVGHLLREDFRSQQVFITKSQKQITTQVATSVIRQDGEPIGFVLNIMDITERKRLEDEVTRLTMTKLADELELQRKQTEMIIHVQENEKERIARELHDGVGQILSLAKLQLEQLESALPAELQLQCKGVMELVHYVTTDIKSLTSDLMPLSIRKLGLESALTSLLERYNAIKGKTVAISCKIHLDGFEMEENKAMHVYRIAQEAINNSMKYSNATTLSFIMMKLKNSVNLIIEDNGRGFDVAGELNKQNSFGLKTMMERAKLLHGKLLINSAFNAGATISLTIPLNLE